MIVVKFELYPWGDESMASEVARGVIYNMGRGAGSTHETGNYHARFESCEGGADGSTPPFYPDGTPPVWTPKPSVLVGEGFVKRFPRLEKGAWPLVLAALDAAWVQQ